MKPFLVTLLLAGALFASSAGAEEGASPPAEPVLAATPAVPDSARLEKDLQSLPWPQFKAVIQAVPKLKAEVDAYGAFGWQYVQARYRTYHWRKSINKLDAEQQRQLAELIRRAKAGKLPLSADDGAGRS